MYGNKKSMHSLLVNLIGIPNLRDSSLSDLNSEDIAAFLQLAENNKVPLLFLRAIRSKITNDFVESVFSQYEEKYEKTLALTKFVASHLENICVHYSFFKTVKPFPYVPSDVDVLLWSSNDLQIAVNSLIREGCTVLDGDAYGVTMFSPIHDLNIDLTTQIAVSGLVYVNKSLLIDHVNEINLHGTTIRTLSPAADLLIVVAHSVFKEQMFTLSDYYNLIIRKQLWKDASILAKKLHLSHAFKTVLMLVGAVTLDAFGSSDLLKKEFEELGITHIFPFNELHIELPKKFSVDSIVVEFINKFATDSSMVNSLPSAALCMCKPNFYVKAFEHITRKRY